MSARILDHVVADSEAIWADATADYALPYHHTIAMATLLRAAGHADVDYGRVLIESGVGLSFAYRRNACVPMYALQWTSHPRIAAATGREVDRTECVSVYDVWSLIVESIDAGTPIATEYAEFHVVAGYRQARGTAERAILVLGNYPISSQHAEWLGWSKMVELHRGCPWSAKRDRVGAAVEPASNAETLANVVGWLVEWATDHPAAGHPLLQGATLGTAAIEAYAADLADLSLTVEDDFGWGNNACHSITPQWTSRRQIAAYLRESAALLGPEAAPHVLRAAAEYEAFVADWVRYDELLGQRLVHVEGGEQGPAWADPARRSEASEAIYRSAAHERAALEHLRLALEARTTDAVH